MLNFSLTEEEFQFLIAKYKTEDNMFNHDAFCAYINLAFTQKGVDKNPAHKVQEVTADATLMARRKYLDIEDQEN